MARTVSIVAVGVVLIMSTIIFFAWQQSKIEPLQQMKKVKELSGKTADTAAVLRKSQEAGVKWLIARQMPGGAWADFQGKSDVGITGLAVTAIAGAGETYRKEYAAQIDKGVSYILSCAQPDGAVIDKDKLPSLATYKTAIAIWALRAVDREKHKKVIEHARDYLVGTQFSDKFKGVGQNDPNYGGWGYAKDDQTPAANLSTTAYALDGLVEAGVPKDDEVFKRAAIFVAGTQNRGESNTRNPAFAEKGFVVQDDGGHVYAPGDTRGNAVTLPNGKKALQSYGSMTYAGLKSFICANVDKKDPRVQAAYGWIRAHYTLEENPGMAVDDKPGSAKQGLYYYYHTFAKALDAYGEESLQDSASKPHAWARELVTTLAAEQKPEGSWVGANPRWWEDNETLVTCYAVLSLNICDKWVK
jgi:squalene-hopene/tetraprenyl-beta-curcumene cyclase